MDIRIPKQLSGIMLLFLPLLALAQNWQWSDHFGGPGHDWGRIGGVDAQGNVYCYGTYAGYDIGQYHDMYIDDDTLQGNVDAFITKHDANGDLLWALNCSSASGFFTIEAMVLDTTNDQLIITGRNAGSSTIGTFVLPDSGTYLAAVDLSGYCTNAENVGSYLTAGTGLVVDDQGYLYLAGIVMAGGVSLIDTAPVAPGSFVAKFDIDGTLLWGKDLIGGTGGPFNQPRYTPRTLRYHGGDIIIHGGAYQYSTSGAFQADTVQSPAVVGGGDALVVLDPETGVAKWVRTVGFSSVGQLYQLQHRMDLDNDGNIWCIGTVDGDSARFGSDTTLVVPAGAETAYLVKYNSIGVLSSIRSYGQDVLFSSIGSALDGTLLLLSSYLGPGSVDVCDGNAGLYMSRLNVSGDCLGTIEVANGGFGLSVQQTGNGIYLSCSTPGAPQFGSSTFAGESITRHGFEDVLLAKHDPAVGVGSYHMAENTELEIYANPNQGSFRLRIPNAFAHEQSLEMAIFDGAGRLVSQGPLDMSEAHPKLDLYGVSPGTYHVVLANGHKTYHGSMVVE